MKLSRARICAAVFCLCLVTASTGFADDLHYVNMHVGNRASGVGGAYTAVSDDPAGCFYNPAGIAFAPSISLSASVNAFTLSTKTYKGALTDVNGNKLDWEQESSSLLPNFFGIVRKFGSGMLGLSYAVPDSIQRRQSQTFDNLTNDIERFTMNINDTDETYLFGPSYAYAFSDSFSVGATMYVYYRDMEVIRNQLIEYEGGGHYLRNYYNTKTDWGYKPILGAIWEPLDKVALGLSLSKIYVTSSDNEEQLIYRDSTDTDNFRDTDEIYFSNRPNSEKNKFPFTTAFGVAYFASPKLLLSGDLTYYEKLSERLEIWNLALGTEYYFTESLAVRAGFYTDMSNRPKEAPSNITQEVIDVYGMTLSLGLFRKTSSITLGVSYGFGTGDAQVVEGSNERQDVEIESFATYIAASYSY